MSKRGLPEQNVQYRGEKKNNKMKHWKLKHTSMYVRVMDMHTREGQDTFNMMQSNATQPIVIKMRLRDEMHCGALSWVALDCKDLGYKPVCCF